MLPLLAHLIYSSQACFLLTLQKKIPKQQRYVFNIKINDEAYCTFCQSTVKMIFFRKFAKFALNEKVTDFMTG